MQFQMDVISALTSINTMFPEKHRKTIQFSFKFKQSFMEKCTQKPSVSNSCIGRQVKMENGDIDIVLGAKIYLMKADQN